MLRLEELLLANLLVRRGLASPADAQTALAALDRAPGHGDLFAILATRAPALAQPGVREHALAAVRRYVLGRSEELTANRLRGSGLVAPPIVDELVARQRAESLSWTLADRLACEGRIDAATRAHLEREVARELEAWSAALVARHRASRFAETVGTGVPGIPSLNVATSSEILRAFDPDATAADAERTVRLAAPSAADLATDERPEGLEEATLRIPPPPAHLLRRTPQGPVPAAVLPAAAAFPLDLSAATVKLPPSGTPGFPGALSDEQRSDPTVRLADEDATPRDGAALDEGGATVRLPAGGAPASPAAARVLPGPLAPGARLADRYEVVAELGRGAMGVVYRARALDRGGLEVALKVVPAQGAAVKEILPRFKREILTASRVHHENVCAVHDGGEAQGLAYMAMELVPGESLRELVDREAPLPVERAVALLEQILRGLEACHAAKVIHRDLKPDNVRIARGPAGETAKIVDFGIARFSDEQAANGEKVFMTVKGVLSGTPSYVAPELIMDEELVSPRADIYAVGVIFYELLTGKLPFRSRTLREILKDSVESSPTTLDDAVPGHSIPPAIERVLFRMLEKDPLVRFGSAREVLAAFEEVRKPAARDRQGFTARLVKRITRLFGRESL